MVVSPHINTLARYIDNMTETGDRLWKKPQIVKDYAKSMVKKHPTGQQANVWSELRDHPSWNNLFTLLENYINRCAELEKKANSQRYDSDETLKKLTIRKKYKKYKKRYKLFKTDNSRMSDSGSDGHCSNQNQTDCSHFKRD